MSSTDALLARHTSSQASNIDVDDDSTEDEKSNSSLSSSDFETTDEDEVSDEEFSDTKESESTSNGIRSELESNGSAQQPQSPRGDTSTPPAGFRMQAYLLSRQALFENRHGVSTTYIYHARILRQGATNIWVNTGEECAVKAVAWNDIRARRSRMSEDILKEVAALQYVSDWHRKAGLGPLSSLDTHVMTADVIMSNETHLLVVMPFCPGGDLCELVAASPQERLTETEARYWFRQILKGLESLQRMRICHRDLSPENFMILENEALVIDFGMCLRIPYTGNSRHLISQRIPAGKKPHVAPEIMLERPLDGHAIDLWAVGTILLFLLTGQRFKNPPLRDHALDRVELGISQEAMDLLRKMFRLDSNDRLSLKEVTNHPWTCSQFLH